MNSTNRRLGRGLGSLIAGGGQVSTFFDEQPIPSEDSKDHSLNPENKTRERDTVIPDQGQESDNRLLELKLEKVVPNPHQPRKVIDPEAIRELANSIESEGLLQPIVVRPADNGYQLIAGERRWRAHQFLGRSTILARVVEASDLSSASLSLIENLQREELNPVEEAMGYHSLISDFNLSQQEVAQRMGKSRSHIANLMRLLQLNDELKRLLADGELSVGHAKVLLGIDDPDRRLAIGHQAVLEGWTVRQIEQAISSDHFSHLTPLPRKIQTSSMFDDLAKSTSLATGRKVKIKVSPKGRGTISFTFKDETDLHSLLAMIDNSSN